MTKEEYKECKFIDKFMYYYTYQDFIDNAFVIRSMFLLLKDIRLYKWYVYSHNMNLARKNAIWEYLNHDIEYEDLLFF